MFEKRKQSNIWKEARLLVEHCKYVHQMHRRNDMWPKDHKIISSQILNDNGFPHANRLNSLLIHRKYLDFHELMNWRI
jgi:hypothetical protein